MARYDVASGLNEAGGRKRRQAQIETGGEESQLRPLDRLRATNLVRDTVRNSPMQHGVAKTLRANIVGSYGKLRFNAAGDWYDGAARYFNTVWARAADFTDGTSWRESLQLVVYALAHDGDFVAVFDDGILSGRKGGTGRLCFFESDQIANLAPSAFEPYAKRGFRQESGIVFDRLGRKCGVVVSSHRGMTEVPKEGSAVLLCDPDDPIEARNWLHVARKFRLRQSRGVADALPAVQSAIDALEILNLELQSAKVSASRYATVYQSNPAADPLAGTGFSQTPAGEGAEGGEAEAAEVEEDLHADALETYTGGNVDYLMEGDKVDVTPANRPNPNLQPFLDYVTDIDGASFGLSHAYSRLKADTSYTAFRGDMVMTWMVFEDFQQFLEDAFSDWVARRVLDRAVGLGILGEPPEGWHESIAWQYPTMPSVDGQKEQAAIAAKLRNGLTSLRKEYGPDWKSNLKELAEERDECRRLGLTLSFMESTPGAVTEPADTDNRED